LFYLYEFVVRVTPGVMDVELQQAFGLSAAQFGGAVAAYSYIYGPMQLVVGSLLDRYGGKKLLVPACVLVAAGSAMLTLPWYRIEWLAAARFIMGFGSSFGFVGVMYLAAMWFPHERLAMVSGLTTTLGILGAIIGVVPLSQAVDIVGWQSVWVGLAFAGVALALVMILSMPGTPPWELKRRKDKTSDESIPKSIARVLRNPQTWIIGGIAACLYMPISVFGNLWGVNYLMTVGKMSKLKASGGVSMLYWGWIIGSPIAGILSDHWKRRKTPLMTGCLVSTILACCVVGIPGLPPYALYTLLFALGLANCFQVITFVANLEIQPQYARGTAVAITNMIVMVAEGIFQHLYGFVLDLARGLTWLQGSGPDSTVYHRVAMGMLPLVLGLGFILALAMKETFHHRTTLATPK
jgi:MFS family permease